LRRHDTVAYHSGGARVTQPLSFLDLLGLFAAIAAILAGSYFVTRFARRLVAVGASPAFAGGLITLLCSAPEVTIVISAWLRSRDRSGLDLLGLVHHVPVGLVLGSSIVNILGVAGLSALIIPGRFIPIRRTTIFRDTLFLILLAGGILFFFFTQHAPHESEPVIRASWGRWLMFLGLGYLVVVTVWDQAAPPLPTVGSTREEREETANPNGSPSSGSDTAGSAFLYFVGAALVLFVGGLVLFFILYPGGNTPRNPNIPPPHSVALLLPIIVALPEFLTARWASRPPRTTREKQLAMRAETLSITSLLSSSIFNLTFVLGLAAVLAAPSSHKLEGSYDIVQQKIENILQAKWPQDSERYRSLLRKCVPVSPDHKLVQPTYADYCQTARAIEKNRETRPDENADRLNPRYFSIQRLPREAGLYVDYDYFHLEAWVLLLGALVLLYLLLFDPFARVARYRLSSDETERYQLQRPEGVVLFVMFLVWLLLRVGNMALENGKEAGLARIFSLGAANTQSYECQSEILRLCEKPPR
jgi:Ca2+/Na+ antiporter